MTNGIDVAKYQASDYSTSGLDFVFVKATEGTSYTNPRHAAQIATGRAHGLVVGHYHFVRPGSMTAQADYFLKQAKPAPGDVLAFDWEDTGVTGLQKDAWLRYVQAKAPDNRVILYCNRDFWLNRDSTSFYADGLWIADPSAPMGHPRIEDDWLFHQYSSAGGTDRNYSPLTAAQLRAWANQQEDDMPITDADAAKIAKAMASYSHGDKPDVHQTWQTAAEQATAAATGVKTLATKASTTTLTDAQLDQLAVKVAASPVLAAAIAKAVVDLEAKRLDS